MDDPTSTILGAGFQLGQLTICVLGVMVIAAEYSTGMIRSSLLAVPKRTPMLAAKARSSPRWCSSSASLLRSRRSSLAHDPAQPCAGVARRSWRSASGYRSRGLPHRARLLRPRDRRDRTAHGWGDHRRHRLHPGARTAHPAAARPHRQARPCVPAVRGRSTDRTSAPSKTTCLVPGRGLASSACGRRCCSPLRPICCGVATPDDHVSCIRD